MSAISPTAGEETGTARWGVAFVVVCALHLGAAALIWKTHMFTVPAADLPPDTVLIDLEPLPTPAVTPPSPPEPPPPEPEVRKEEPPPPPVKAEVVLPKPPPPKPRPPRPQKVEEPPPQPMPEQPVAAPPKPDVTPVPRAQTAHSPSADAVTTWERQLLARLQSFLRYPRRAQLRQQDGIAYVRVVVDRQGNAVTSELQRSSGIPLLDDEAVAVVLRAQPLPPPPPEVRGEQVVRVVPVRFILR
jgi:protein TonB